MDPARRMSADYPTLSNTGKDNEQCSGLRMLERITYRVTVFDPAWTTNPNEGELVSLIYLM